MKHKKYSIEVVKSFSDDIFTKYEIDGKDLSSEQKHDFLKNLNRINEGDGNIEEFVNDWNVIHKKDGKVKIVKLF